MATVIDELIVELKLDPKGFTEGQKKMTDSLRKMEDEAGKSNKKIHAGADKLTEAFSALQGRLLAIGALFMGGMGVRQFIEHMTRLTSQTGYFSAAVGISAAELVKWENAGKTVGAQAGSIGKSLVALKMHLVDMQLYGKGQLDQFARVTQQAGQGPAVDPRHANGQWKSPTEIALEISRWASSQKNRAVASRLLSGLGMEQDMQSLMFMGPDKLGKLLREMESAAPTEEQVKNAQELQKAFGEMSVAADKLRREIVDRLTPGLIAMFNTISGWLDSLGQNKTPANTATDILGGTAKGIYDWYKDPIGNIKSGATYLWDKGKGLFGGSTPTPGASGSFSGGGNGSWASGPGGTRGDRNRNPGNIKYGDFARKHGATGADDKGFAIFPTLEAGKNAADILLQEKYSGLTLSQIQSKWVDGAHIGYLRGMMKSTGLGPHDVPDLQNPQMRAKVLEGIARGEGTQLSPGGTPLSGSPTSSGPGRVNFMSGPAPGRDQLTTVTTNGGVKFTVNKASAPYFLGFLNDMEAAGAPIKSIGGHSHRTIAGSSRLSQHAYGNAIDVNMIGRNITTHGLKEWADANAGKLAMMENKWGMVSGAKWRNPDFGHWEWGGSTAGMAIGSRGAVMGPSTTNNRTNQTNIDNLNVTVPPGADPAAYASGISQELQRYETDVMNANTGIF